HLEDVAPGSGVEVLGASGNRSGEKREQGGYDHAGMRSGSGSLHSYSLLPGDVDAAPGPRRGSLSARCMENRPVRAGARRAFFVATAATVRNVPDGRSVKPPMFLAPTRIALAAALVVALAGMTGCAKQAATAGGSSPGPTSVRIERTYMLLNASPFQMSGDAASAQ